MQISIFLKRCSKCEVKKPLDQFYSNKSTPDGKSWYCKSCFTQVERKWKRENKEKAASTARKTRRKRLYGLSEGDYDRLIAASEGRCDCCDTQFNNTKNRDIHIDHCHTTGRVRGLLCNKCNITIGMADESIEKLEAAIKYLERIDM